MAVVLGINPGWIHDASACVVIDGKLVCVAEEERFVRVKHAPGFPPKNAVKSCLERARLTPYDVNAIAISFDVGKIWRAVLTAYWLRFGINPRRWPSLPFHMALARHWATSKRRILVDSGVPSDIKADVFFVEHHKAHAASAYLPSGFDQSTVITVDGAGETNSAVVWDARETLTKLREESISNSLGLFYSYMTSQLGFEQNEGEGKTMALAGYGKPNPEITKKMGSIIGLADQRGWRLNGQFARDPTSNQRGLYGTQSSRHIIDVFGRPGTGGVAVLEPPFPDIAFATQDALERALLNLVRAAVGATGKKKVCLAGGVALNCKANGTILESGVVEDIFVFPAPGDAGTSIGAALEVARLLGDSPNWRMEHAYYGSDCSDDEIDAVVRRLKVPYERHEDIAGTVGEMVAKHQIVGWFQGKAELGPRALGNRSILADPGSTTVRDRVNEIKGRERWRPLCPSILDDAKDEYFADARSAPFMTVSFRVKETKEKEIAGVVHVDGTTRPQTVKRETNPLYWRLIRTVEEKIGVPMVMNTSFNLKGEPLVNSPLDAVRDFYTSSLDALAIGHFLLKKSP